MPHRIDASQLLVLHIGCAMVIERLPKCSPDLSLRRSLRGLHANFSGLTNRCSTKPSSTAARDHVSLMGNGVWRYTSSC
jgi:hypothetical protein